MTKNRKNHHHGDLKRALVEAGTELLAEGGHSALTLRKCAARAGVSHAAPAHHFDGVRGLLTAIVTRGFTEFANTMIARRDASANTPRARLVGVCEGYLEFARNNEAMSTLMFAKEEVNFHDQELSAASMASYTVLAEACAPFKPGPGGGSSMEMMIWSLVQGYATLARTGMLNPEETFFEDILSLLKLEQR